MTMYETTAPIATPPITLEHELARRLGERERPGRRGGDRELERGQRGRVVDEALALEHRDDPPRRAHASGDGGRRHGIGRPEDRAEHDRGLPRQAVDQLVRDPRDAERRRQHEPDCEQADRPRVAAQLAQVGEQRGRVEQRRQRDDEDEVGVEPDVGHPRDEREQRAADGQPDRVRDARDVGEDEQDADAEQDPGERPLEVRRERKDQAAHGRVSVATASAATPSSRPDEPDPLAGRGLDVDAIGSDAERAGERVADRRLVRRDLRPLHAAASCRRGGSRAPRAARRRRSAARASPRPRRRVAVGEVLADVAEARRAEQRVHDRVGQDVGVGVALQPERRARSARRRG